MFIVSFVWQVVVDLIMEMKGLGHPSYTSVQEEVVLERAATLPDNDVPREVMRVIKGDDALCEDRLEPQKAATPRDGSVPLADVGTTFSSQRPRGILAEGHRDPQAHVVEVAAIAGMQRRLSDDISLPIVPEVEVCTGNRLVDQFQPHYFAMAFPFCFKFATARPDVRNSLAASEGLSRRLSADTDAPEVDVFKWAGAMVRRVETQFRRDWNFGFLLWNYLFRTLVNQEPNVSMYAMPAGSGGRVGRMMTNEEIAEGAKEVMRLLRDGKYQDITGSVKAIQGDFTKVRHAVNLSIAAKKILQNVEARARNISGTHEVRKSMRYQTHANRVCFGTAIFVTISPSERDSTLMVRLARARVSDPAVITDGSGLFQRRDVPPLDVDYMRLSPDELIEDI